MAIETFNIYGPGFPILKELLKKTDEKEIVDLCSGGGGPARVMTKAINNPAPDKYRVKLTDKYPNIETFKLLQKDSPQTIEYSTDSIDVTDVPAELSGVRTIFSAFHHFEPARAKKILADAVANRKPIAIFEAGERRLLDIFGVIITSPILFFFLTPFMRPFKWSRIFLTYVIPLIPLTTIFDGIVSMFRMYHPHELLAMANEVEPDRYVWESNRIPDGVNKVIYLTGYPKSF
jgi:hypothetical protein